MGSLEDPDSVDERRTRVGFKTLEEELGRQRPFVDLEPRPRDLRARQAGLKNGGAMLDGDSRSASVS